MFDWGTLIDLAEKLADPSDEARSRAAVSRAYYGAFNLSKRYLQRELSVTTVPDTGAAHHVVWKDMEARGKALRRVGITGSRLKKARWQVDYDDSITRLADVVTTALGDAKNIRRLLQEERAAKAIAVAVPKLPGSG